MTFNLALQPQLHYGFPCGDYLSVNGSIRHLIRLLCTVYVLKIHDSARMKMVLTMYKKDKELVRIWPLHFGLDAE